MPRWTVRWTYFFNTLELKATFLTLTCASSPPGRFYGKLATFQGGCDRAVRGSEATPDNSEGRIVQPGGGRSGVAGGGGGGGCVCVGGIHASRRGFVLSRAESQNEPAAVSHLADDGLVNDEQPPTWT